MALRGSECRAGEVVLRTGDLLTPLAVGVLASVGLREVRVIPAPTIGILTTGGELIGGGAPESAQIRDSNGPMLAAMAASCGLKPAWLLHAQDDVRAIAAALETMHACDLIVLTGGVSMGRYDLVPDSFQQIGAEVVFHKVSQKPGKPLLFARRGRQLFFGLPGNPLAAHLWFVLGHAECEGDTRRTWSLRPMPGRSSADLFGPNQANCYLEVPPGDELVAAGESLTFEWLVMGAPAPLPWTLPAVS
jgi:molybdenum cofactor synthesis domain-containing protein